MKTIGVDFGATYTRFGLWEDGVLIKKLVYGTPRKRSQIAEMFRDAFGFLKRWGANLKTPVGIASVGPLSIGEGLVVNPPNIGRITINLRDIIKKIHGAEPVILNDCTAAALAESTVGPWKGRKNIVYVTLSTGIGGGAIVDGHLLIGKNGNAVEIGHLVVDYESTIRCGCGGLGHWEAMCSGTGIPKLVKELYSKTLWRSAEEVFDAASKGDERARKIIEKISELNAAGFASVVNAYDPEVLIVGGGVALNHPHEMVYAAAKKAKKFLTLQARIVTSTLGHDAPLLGACVAAAIDK